MPHLKKQLLNTLPPARRSRFPRGYVRVLCGTACTQECRTCPFSHGDDRSFREAAEVRRQIAAARDKRARGVLLSGGEPTAHPEIRSFVADARMRGMAAAVATNAVRLAQDKLRQDLVAAGLGSVHLHLFSADPKLHEELAGGEADLELSLKALTELRRAGVRATVVIPLLKQTLEGITELRDRAAAAKANALHLAMPALLSAPEEAHELALLSKAVAAAVRDSRFERVTFDGLPLCVVPRLLKHRAVVLHRDPVVPPVDDPDKLAVPCRDCAAVGSCPAPIPAGSDTAGGRVPFIGPRSNSYNYVLGEVLARHDDDWTCPIREGELKKPRLSSNRGLILRNGGLLQVATTDSADFRGPELRRIRDEMGQVYLDVSEKLLLDDFATDLARLAPDPVCDGCHLLPGCPGMFAPAQDASSCFDAAERELIEVLRTVSGRVLDVGMGEPRSLLPLLVVDEPEDEEDEDDVEPQEPHLPFDYVGIEPFAPRAYQLSETFPFATVVTAAAEDPRLAKLVEAEERPFDHVLLLRSYNHLRDLHAAFENLLRLLKPGGGLVLVENTAFGLVRSDRKTRALSKLEAKGEAKFEHYRNHSSHEALEVLRPFGLELVAHYPVEAGKANQWLIWMRKPS